MKSFRCSRFERRIWMVRQALLVCLGWCQLEAFEFTDVSTEAGITHHFDQDPDNYLPSWDPAEREFVNMAGGAVAEDFDGDGWVDLFVLRGGIEPNLLYVNQGDGTFVDEAALRGADQSGLHVGVCGADYDSDGDVDLLITAVEGPHLLLINDGTGNFSVQSGAVPSLTTRTTSPSWADIDGDGLPDLAMGSWAADEGEKGDIHIYRNKGAEGLVLFQVIPMNWVFVTHFADLNGDGLADLVAVADFQNTRIFLNDGRGIMLPAGGSDIQNGMGVATGDPDMDGDLDIFMTAIQHRNPDSNVTNTDGNRLLLNNGHGEFTDTTTDAGVRAGYWGWGAVFGDFDLDGDEDIYHVNGFNTYYDLSGPFKGTPSVLFENLGSMEFAEVALTSGAAGETGQGRCVVTLDYDRDGDLDLFLVNNNDVHPVEGSDGVTLTPGELVLLRNDTEPRGNWLRVGIDGRAPYHSQGLGVGVRLELADRTLIRELSASSNFNGHGSCRTAHFGVGGISQIEVLRAVFPNGDSVSLEEVSVNQELVIESPWSVAENRHIGLGGGPEVLMPAELIPPGGVVVWSHGDIESSNPADLVFTEVGTQSLEVRVYSDISKTTLLRSESLRMEVVDPSEEGANVARIWNELALDAIRIDFPNPGVHARNLFHLSVAMWDAWAAYDAEAVGYLHRESISSAEVEEARREAISYAAYRLLSSRYAKSLNASASQLYLDFLMEDLGYDVSVTELEGDSPAALGNRIAATVIEWGGGDGSLEEQKYFDSEYRAVNPPLVLAESGTTMADPNRWQPLKFEVALTQNGLFTLRNQIYAGSQWGEVRPFSLLPTSTTYLDPGPPPMLGGAGHEDYLAGALEVISFSSWLDPDDGVLIDISPKSKGLNQLGQNDGTGHGVLPNPSTGELYQEQWVKRGDYGRVIAEFWADGPDSETPPGHWNTLANRVSDHPALVRRFKGQGTEMGRLEWDVKLYFALNAALHDAAVAAWGCKRYYDYVRPISSIRHLSATGQLPEVAGLVERITESSSADGERHAHLVAGGASPGQTAIFAWGGEPADPQNESTGTRWILGEDWLPYQRSTFVTPAFPGYVSGHSTFSRAAAEVLASFTGDPYFPGGMETHHVPASGLEFEDGPSTDLTLQWATYYDAADEAGLSRLYGGIHFAVDDGPGRVMGAATGIGAMELASRYFDGSITREVPSATVKKGPMSTFLKVRVVRGFHYRIDGSSDLATWTEEIPKSFALDSEVILPIDPNPGRKFYRVIQDENP